MILKDWYLPLLPGTKWTPVAENPTSPTSRRVPRPRLGPDDAVVTAGLTVRVRGGPSSPHPVRCHQQFLAAQSATHALALSHSPRRPRLGRQTTLLRQLPTAARRPPHQAGDSVRSPFQAPGLFALGTASVASPQWDCVPLPRLSQWDSDSLDHCVTSRYGTRARAALGHRSLHATLWPGHVGRRNRAVPGYPPRCDTVWPQCPAYPPHPPCGPSHSPPGKRSSHTS